MESGDIVECDDGICRRRMVLLCRVGFIIACNGAIEFDRIGEDSVDQRYVEVPYDFLR